MNRRQFLAAAGLLLAAPAAAVEAAKKREDDLRKCRLLMEWLNRPDVTQSFTRFWHKMPPIEDMAASMERVASVKRRPTLGQLLEACPPPKFKVTPR